MQAPRRVHKMRVAIVSCLTTCMPVFPVDEANDMCPSDDGKAIGSLLAITPHADFTNLQL